MRFNQIHPGKKVYINHRPRCECRTSMYWREKGKILRTGVVRNNLNIKPDYIPLEAGYWVVLECISDVNMNRYL